MVQHFSLFPALPANEYPTRDKILSNDFPFSHITGRDQFQSETSWTNTSFTHLLLEECQYINPVNTLLILSGLLVLEIKRNINLGLEEVS